MPSLSKPFQTYLNPTAQGPRGLQLQGAWKVGSAHREWIEIRSSYVETVLRNQGQRTLGIATSHNMLICLAGTCKKQGCTQSIRQT